MHDLRKIIIKTIVHRKVFGHIDLNFPVFLNKDEMINFGSVQSQKLLISAALDTVVVNFL